MDAYAAAYKDMKREVKVFFPHNLLASVAPLIRYLNLQVLLFLYKKIYILLCVLREITPFHIGFTCSCVSVCVFFHLFLCVCVCDFSPVLVRVFFSQVLVFISENNCIFACLLA